MEQNPDEEYFKHLFIKKMDQMIAYNKKRKAQEIKLKERNEMKFALKIPEICITLEAYIQSENSLNNVNDDKDNDNDEFTIDIPEKEMEELSFRDDSGNETSASPEISPKESTFPLSCSTPLEPLPNPTNLRSLNIEELLLECNTHNLLPSSVYNTFLEQNNLPNILLFLELFEKDSVESTHFHCEFSLFDHRRIAELLYELFPEEYVLGLISNNNKEIERFLYGLYTMLKKDYEDILKGVNSMDGDKGWKIIEQEKSKLEIEYRLNHQKMYQNALNRNHSKTKGQLYSSEDYFIPAQNSDHSEPVTPIIMIRLEEIIPVEEYTQMMQTKLTKLEKNRDKQQKKDLEKLL